MLVPGQFAAVQLSPPESYVDRGDLLGHDPTPRRAVAAPAWSRHELRREVVSPAQKGSSLAWTARGRRRPHSGHGRARARAAPRTEMSISFARISERCTVVDRFGLLGGHESRAVDDVAGLAPGIASRCWQAGETSPGTAARSTWGPTVLGCSADRVDGSAGRRSGDYPVMGLSPLGQELRFARMGECFARLAAGMADPDNLVSPLDWQDLVVACSRGLEWKPGIGYSRGLGRGEWGVSRAGR